MKLDKIIFIPILTLFLLSCASKSTIGKNIQIADSNSAYLSKCTILGPVKFSFENHRFIAFADTKKELEYRLKDKAALKFKNADTITYSDVEINSFSKFPEKVTGTAFNCFNEN